MSTSNEKKREFVLKTIKEMENDSELEKKILPLKQ